MIPPHACLIPFVPGLIPIHRTGCSVLRYDCDYRQTFMEASACDAKTHLCTCGPGYCGYNVSDDGHMVCAEGFGAPCMACPRGSFKTSTSLAACEPCGPGYSTKYAGATQKEDCLPLCSNGTASATGFEVLPDACSVLLPPVHPALLTVLVGSFIQPCMPCPLGTFQPSVGWSWCLECPFGSNTTLTGASSEVSPPLSTYCTPR